MMDSDPWRIGHDFTPEQLATLKRYRDAAMLYLYEEAFRHQWIAECAKCETLALSNAVAAVLAKVDADTNGRMDFPVALVVGIALAEDLCRAFAEAEAAYFDSEVRAKISERAVAKWLQQTPGRYRQSDVEPGLRHLGWWTSLDQTSMIFNAERGVEQ